jgi:von Willebrand factor
MSMKWIISLGAFSALLAIFFSEHVSARLIKVKKQELETGVLEKMTRALLMLDHKQDSDHKVMEIRGVDPCEPTFMCKAFPNLFFCKKAKEACENADDKTDDSDGNGDPHYHTLDGKYWHFMGTCSYYLVISAEFQVTVSMSRCGGIWNSVEPSCTDGIEAEIGETKVKLRRDTLPSISVNGKVVTTALPYENSDIHCFQAGNQQIIDMKNGVIVKFTGYSYDLDVPKKFCGQIYGLAGQYDLNPENDFIKSDGTLAETKLINGLLFADDFGNSWVVPGSCPAKREIKADHPCNAIFSAAFGDCHQDKLKHDAYQGCVMDYQSCPKGKELNCLCPALERLVDDCNFHHEPVLNWRQQVCLMLIFLNINDIVKWRLIMLLFLCQMR